MIEVGTDRYYVIIASLHFKQLITSQQDLKLQIESSAELQTMDSNVVEIHISDNCCNDIEELILRDYRQLMVFEVGDGSCSNVNTFIVDNCTILQHITIGKGSFTSVPNWSELKDDDAEANLNRTDRTFSVSNCSMLNKIVIGEGSFVDYAGGITLESLCLV